MKPVAHFLHDDTPHAALEDGTLHYIGIAEASIGLKTLQELGMPRIERHVEAMRLYTYGALKEMKHSNGQPLCEIYGAHEKGRKAQGGIITFNVLHSDGTYVHPMEVEETVEALQTVPLQFHSIPGAAASQAGKENVRIQIRAGCCCNPGACYAEVGVDAFELFEEEREEHAQRCSVLQPGGQVDPLAFSLRQQQNPQEEVAARPCEAICSLGSRRFVKGLPVGAVRVSLGYPTIQSDVDVFLAVLRSQFVS